jgi:microcystin-dependent protein
MPGHTHQFLASANTASSPAPANQVPALTQASTITAYGADNPKVPLAAASVGAAGGSQPHDNCMPFLCVDFIIALNGVFPSQT